MPADEKYWRQALSGDPKGIKYSLMRTALGGLEALYAAGLSLYLASERVGLRSREKLDVPVISVGNLSVGGTGKTPMTQFLARKLAEAGYRPAVLNRGYGGALSPDSAVVSDEDGQVILSAREAGDEAVLLARSLPGIPVVVGKDRRISARIALDRFASKAIVLDDGFQYWQLARDLDIVLLDSRRPFDNGHALPRGFLREPKENLSRAGVVVLTRSSAIDEAARAAAIRSAAALAPSSSVFVADHAGDGVAPLNSRASSGRPDRPLLVCAIAQPRSFEETAEDEGIDFVGPTLAFPDHQPYGENEAAAIIARMKECGANSVITTEKDAVKMGPDFLAVPLYALKIRMKVRDEVLFWETVRLRAGLVEPLHA